MADIKHFVVIKAPAAKVYQAITEQDGLAGWWTTGATAKPQIGFINEFYFDEQHFNKMKVVRLDKSRRIDWDCVDGDPQWIGTHLSFELEEKDGSTGLHFTHANWKDASPFFESCTFNWGFYLNSLRELCVKGKGTPYQEREYESYQHDYNRKS
jgi:uncharacterized protein YndB with AHSA1/START domain